MIKIISRSTYDKMCLELETLRQVKYNQTLCINGNERKEKEMKGQIANLNDQLSEQKKEIANLTSELYKCKKRAESLACEKDKQSMTIRTLNNDIKNLKQSVNEKLGVIDGLNNELIPCAGFADGSNVAENIQPEKSLSKKNKFKNKRIN